MADRAKIMSMLGKDAKIEKEYLAEFMPPMSFSPSDTAMNGGEDEVMVSYKMKPDGRMCITKVGGIQKDMEGGMEEEEVVEEESY